MVGIPISSTPSLIEIADACYDYRTSGISIKNYANIKKTDGTFSGAGTSSNPLKFSQFAGKNINYKHTITELAANRTDGYFYTGIQFNASPNCEWLVAISWAGGYSFNAAKTDGTATRELSGGNVPSWSWEYGRGISISDDGNLVVVKGRVSGYYGGYYWNGQDCMHVLRWSSSGYVSVPDSTYGFDFMYWSNPGGYAFGRTVKYGNDYYIPWTSFNSSGYTIVYSNNSYTYVNVVDVVASNRQLSTDLQRYFVVTYDTNGHYARVYRNVNGTWTLEKSIGPFDITAPFQVSMYASCDPTISTITTPGSKSIWYRTGTTWTQYNSGDIDISISSDTTYAISDEGTRVFVGTSNGQLAKKYTSNPKWYTIDTNNTNTNSYPLPNDFYYGAFGWGYNDNYPRIFIKGNNVYGTAGPYGSGPQGDRKIRMYKLTISNA